jgi:hypothetical protein
LLFPVDGLANANAEAFVADDLIRLLLDGRPFEEGVVTSNLRGHRCERKLVLSCNLRETSLATEGRTGKLEESGSGRLGDCQLRLVLLIVPLMRLHLQERS